MKSLGHWEHWASNQMNVRICKMNEVTVQEQFFVRLSHMTQLSPVTSTGNKRSPCLEETTSIWKPSSCPCLVSWFFFWPFVVQTPWIGFLTTWYTWVELGHNGNVRTVNTLRMERAGRRQRTWAVFRKNSPNFILIFQLENWNFLFMETITSTLIAILTSLRW